MTRATGGAGHHLDDATDPCAGDRVALIHDSSVTGSSKSFTYAELRDEVARFAGATRRPADPLG